MASRICVTSLIRLNATPYDFSRCILTVARRSGEGQEAAYPALGRGCPLRYVRTKTPCCFHGLNAIVGGLDLVATQPQSANLRNSCRASALPMHSSTSTARG